MTGRLLFFARDPGSANQIIALLKLVESHASGARIDNLTDDAVGLVDELSTAFRDAPPLLMARDIAFGILRAADLEPVAWRAPPTDMATLELLRANDVTMVITGFSDRDDHTPQALWRAAANCGARSMAIADDNTLGLRYAAADLYQRFTDANGHRIHPDRVCVVDGPSRQALEVVGIPGDAILTTGNLHLRRFRETARAIDPSAVSAVRRQWRANENDCVILFASEPISQMRPFGKERAHDEISALEELLSRVRAGQVSPRLSCGRTTLVVVRPHPRDDVRKFDTFVGQADPRLIVSRAGSSAEAILAADATVGIASMLLVEAAALDRPSFSLIDFDPQAAAQEI